MSVPVTVVTGFLGAGKTTFINGMLLGTQRIAAIVNDFGAINIDAELIAQQSDTVIGLANGCVCCSLQGDLLRTLRSVLQADPPPERIVIEASGVADPGGILEVLSDRILWREVRTDSVICVVDAADLAATPARLQDPLWQAQRDAASLVILTKTAALPEPEVDRLSRIVSPLGRPPVVVPQREDLPADLLYGPGLLPAAAPRRAVQSDARFVSVEWFCDHAVSLAAVQALIGRFARHVLRAKGILQVHEQPGQSLLLQLTGSSATLEPMPQAAAGCRLVFIGEATTLDRSALLDALDTLH